jgi:uncharacterized membrane protein/predicted DsbA family dithiol-disulfide isomerase
MASPLKPSRLPAVFAAAVGLTLSLVLEVVHYRAYTAPSASSFCSVGEVLDCTSVALSRYSVLLGLPVPLWGVAGFGAALLAAWFRSRWLLPLAFLTSLASVGLLALEVFAIGAVCLLCEGAHVASFVLSFFAWRSRGTATGRYLAADGLLSIFAPPAGLALGLYLFLPTYWGAFSWKGELPFPQGVTADGYPWIGAEQPTLEVHEVTDYSCPHCKVASNRVLRELAAHPRQLRVVRRQYTRMTCPPGLTTSCQLARVAYCAQAQGRFWQADRWLFEHATARHSVDLGVAARDIGLDENALRSCVVSDATYARADADAKDARKKRIVGTPHYIVGGKALSAAQLSRRLDEL